MILEIVLAAAIAFFLGVLVGVTMVIKCLPIDNLAQGAKSYYEAVALGMKAGLKGQAENDVTD